MAVGRMKLDPLYVLHQLTLEEFMLIYEGWELEKRYEMENLRLLCFNIYNSSMNKSKNITIQEFMPLEWDNKKKDSKTKEVVLPTKDDMERGKKLIEQLNKKQDG